jgi:hypothetical protein
MKAAFFGQFLYARIPDSVGFASGGPCTTAEDYWGAALLRQVGEWSSTTTNCARISNASLQLAIHPPNAHTRPVILIQNGRGMFLATG